LSYWFDVASSDVSEDCTDRIEEATLLLRGEIDVSSSASQDVCNIDAAATDNVIRRMDRFFMLLASGKQRKGSGHVSMVE